MDEEGKCTCSLFKLGGTVSDEKVFEVEEMVTFQPRKKLVPSINTILRCDSFLGTLLFSRVDGYEINFVLFEATFSVAFVGFLEHSYSQDKDIYTFLFCKAL